MVLFKQLLLAITLLGLLLAGEPNAFGARDHRSGREERLPVVAPKSTHLIQFPVNGLNYSPGDLTILLGDDVEWSGDFAMHPLVSEDDLWTMVEMGSSFTYTFTAPGTYRYYCSVHGAAGGIGMSGIVRVVSAQRLVYLPQVSR